MGTGGRILCLLAAALLLPACSPLSQEQAGQLPVREIQPLSFERLEDTPASRAAFPCLAPALDEAAAFNREFPGAVASEVHVAVVEGNQTGGGRDLVLVQLRGTANCGTLGCLSWVLEIDQDGSARTLLNAYTHPSAPPALSRCGETVSFLLITGHGMELGWTEWLLSGRTLDEVTLTSTGATPESPPPCAPRG